MQSYWHATPLCRRTASSLAEGRTSWTSLLRRHIRTSCAKAPPGVYTTTIREKNGIRGNARTNFFSGGKWLRELDPQPKGLDTGRDVLP
eukprot:1212903-Amphidinium_carterae.1